MLYFSEYLFINKDDYFDTLTATQYSGYVRWIKLSFPRLLDNNLISSDFFDEDKSFNNRKFDVIIGNPPWQSNITRKTKEYLKKANRVIGDKQIAQAFSIKCSELCKQSGIICLLMPSKGLLFNRSDKSRTM